MDEIIYYEAPEYHPPKIVVSIGSLLRGPREFYTTKFSDVMSTDSEAQHKYVDGLLAVEVFLLSVLVAWLLVLIVLKVKGREVGCASGRAFHTEKSEDDLARSSSTDSSDGYMTSESESDGIGKLQQHIDQQEPATSFDQHYEEAESYCSEAGWLSTESSTAPKKKKGNRRERRTRFCFIFFSLISLVCVPFILVFSFSPMKEATRSSEDILLAARDAVDQVKASLNAIESSAQSAVVIVSATPTDLKVLCPLIDKDDTESELGIDLSDLVDTLTGEFNEMMELVNFQLGLVKNGVDRIDGGMVTFEESVDTVDELMWIVPGLLFAVSMLTAISMLGVLLAWKGKSGVRIQRAMSYFVLPLLIIASIACWIVAIMASFGTMVSSDMCTSGPFPGSPDQTIQEILSSHGLGQNDTIYKLVNAYTNRCMGSDPTEDVNELEKMVQETIDTIWRQISRVDSIGRAKLIEQCGGESLTDLFAGARNVAKLLTVIRRSLDSASVSLSCKRINPIYSEAAHNAVCTDVASAAAFGFLMFVILAISTMTIVSLRASWLRNIEEEKNYHDESENAENMILDEHEEYLAYISKYKHEWQEYNGFDTKSVAQSNEGSSSSYDDSKEESSEDSLYFDDEGKKGPRTDGKGCQWSDECSEGSSVTNPKGLDVEIFPTSLYAPSVQDGAIACGIDDISFPSLSYDSASVVEENLFAKHSLLLPPPENPDYREVDPVQSMEVRLQEDKTRLPRTSSPRKKSTSPRKKNSKAKNSDPNEGQTSFFDRHGIYPNKTGEEVELEPIKRLDAPNKGQTSFFDRYGIYPNKTGEEVELEPIKRLDAPGNVDDRDEAPGGGSRQPSQPSRPRTRTWGDETNVKTAKASSTETAKPIISQGEELARKMVRRRSANAALARNKPPTNITPNTGSSTTMPPHTRRPRIPPARANSYSGTFQI